MGENAVSKMGLLSAGRENWREDSRVRKERWTACLFGEIIRPYSRWHFGATKSARLIVSTLSGERHEAELRKFKDYDHS